MLSDIMLFLDRKELEFLKAEVLSAIEDVATPDKEWAVLLAAKLIKACNENDAIEKSESNENQLNRMEF